MHSALNNGTIYWKVSTSNGEAEAMSHSQSQFFFSDCTDWPPTVRKEQANILIHKGAHTYCTCKHFIHRF